MIRVKVDGLGELIQNMGKTKTMVKPIIASGLNQISMSIKQKAKENAPVAFGGLKQGISHTVNKSKLEGIVWSKKNYGIFVERGTRPHFPPITPIKKWTARVLHNPSPAVAWAVARKIAREGTEAQPFMQPALIANRAYMQQVFGNIAKQLVLIMKYGR